MKKILSAAVAFVLAAVSVLILAGCTKSPFETYFKEYASVEGFTRAEASLTLPEGVFVEGYFENADRFTIKKDTGLKDSDGKPVYAYGIASRTEVLIDPSFLWIYDVDGDYAIVSRLNLDENNQVFDSFGLIRIFGKNLYSDMTTFRHTVVSEESPPIRFIGDYIAILGDRYANGTDRFTFYDKEMNDAFRVTANVFANFSGQEDWIVCYPDTTRAEFYKLDRKDANGFLQKTDEYAPFSEEDIIGRNCSLVVNYLGNGWFLRTATAASDTNFTGYNVLLNTSAERYPYVRNTSDRYDANSKIAYNNQTLMPVLAVNRYNRAEMRDLATYYNQIEVPSEEDGLPVYQFPVYPVSDLVSDGYTVVYSYYYIDEASKSVDISFAILDGTANAPTIISSIYMPLLFVDGVGFEVDSPYFNPVYYQAGVFDRSGKLNVLESAVENYSYASVAVHHGGLSVVRHIDLLAAGSEELTYEAYQGNRLAVNYGRYKEFTPYFSGAATASRYDKKTKKRTYYTVNENGGETEIHDVLALKNGVYITRKTVDEQTVYGISNNLGVPLLENKPSIQVYELFLKDGKFMESMVYTVENGRGVVYRLK